MAKAKPPIDTSALLAAIDEWILSHGAVPRAEMKRFRRHLPLLAPELARRGYEVAATVRRPLSAQVLAALAGGFVSDKALERAVTGATPREIKATATDLARRGEISRVVRDLGLGWALPSVDRIEGPALSDLFKALIAAQKLLRKAGAANKAPVASLLHEDLRRLLDVPLPLPLATTTTRGASRELLAKIAERVGDAPLPLRVPDLLRSLGADAEEGCRALLEGASRGLFELEPESGMGRLSRDDAELCPPGPMGTRLSWVRASARTGPRRGASEQVPS